MKLWGRKSRRERLAERLRDALPEAVTGLPERAVEAVAEGAERLGERVREAVPERVLEALPESVAERISPSRQRFGWLRFTLGIISGVAAGGAAGLLVAPAPGGDGGLVERIEAFPERARTAFERGRAQVLQAGVDAEHGAAQVQQALTSAVGSGTAEVAEPLREFRQTFKARWNDAMLAGKAAAAEREAELRREYLGDTHRL